jgi:succinate dehydrogenase / fumarate reductase membrane anchor subunit
MNPTAAWLLQRASAVAMALYLFAAGTMLAFGVPWRTMFAPDAMRIATLLFFAALALHAWIGMRDILMDYVKPLALRLALYLAVQIALAGYTAWAARILWRG